MADAIPVNAEVSPASDGGQAQFAKRGGKKTPAVEVVEQVASIVDYKVDGGVELESHKAVREDH